MIKARVDKRPKGYKLTHLVEDSRGVVPRPSTVRDMANILLAALTLRSNL